MGSRNARAKVSISVSRETFEAFRRVCSRAGVSVSFAVESLIVNALRTNTADSICRSAACFRVRISAQSANRLAAISEKTGKGKTEIVNALVAKEALFLACDEYSDNAEGSESR